MSQMTKTTQIDPNKVTYIQSRAEMNPALIDEYVSMIVEGVAFDPAEGLQDDSGQIFIWDGAHRTEAARRANQLLTIRIRPGSRPEAEWLALSANQKHGLRRSRADKQRVVRQALLHLRGAQLSNREIARHCGVDHKTVGRVRRELEVSGEIPRISERTVNRNGTSYRLETKKPIQAAAASPDQPQRNTEINGTPADADIREFSSNGNQQHPGLPKTPQAPSGVNGHNYVLEEDQPHPCPQCHEQRVRGVNGSQRWCIGGGASWPTAASFLANAASTANDNFIADRRQDLAARFKALLPHLLPAQLTQLETVLTQLEMQPESGS